ncbi:uncharacterized protein LOC129719600 [Wyeomyia smithii]|uniref:uncharacterized protein LOC129719600 n=1 Tax=Wyeomyia smithii TaxID=174621 RepID=UPI002467C6EF|nr:uncharacterized protein LOC129719600 [Wyeomyia smithii]
MLLAPFLIIGFVKLSLADEISTYDMQLVKVETVAGSEQYFEYNYTLDKLSEMSFKISGNIRQLVIADNRYEISMKLSRAELSDAADPPAYEELIEVTKPLCEFLKSIYRMYFYEDLKDISNFPHYDTCPLPVADYWFKDYAFEGESYQAFMSDGRYKLECYLMQEGVIAGGAVASITITPIAKTE